MEISEHGSKNLFANEKVPFAAAKGGGELRKERKKKHQV